MDAGGRLGGVEARHSEAWAGEPADLARHWLEETEDAPEELLQSEPADLARHWLGETEDASEELPRTVQGPGEEPERPRPHGASSEAPREQALQGGEREGWPGSCKRAQRQVDLSRRVGTAVSKKRRLPSGSERSSEAKRRPAQRLSCEARTYGFVCRWEAAAEAAQGEQSGCQEEATPAAAGKDESDLLTEDRNRAGLRGSADRGSCGSQGWDPGGLLMGA